MPEIFDNIRHMLHAIENYHDYFTNEHELRTGKLIGMLATAYGLEKKKSVLLEKIGSIHDIGKISLPKSILEKPGPLTKLERKIIEMHPYIGFEIIKKINLPIIDLAGMVILTHHENFNGTGYPLGLKGESIPIEGRICAICDVYDALREERSYRAPKAHDEVFNMILDDGPKGLSYKFDPKILSIFKALSKEIKELYL